jgi:hypothetical protein
MDASAKTRLFFAALLLLTAHHYLPLVAKAREMERLRQEYRLRFNEALASGRYSTDHLRMMKSLINNIEHCKNHRILENGIPEEVEREYKELEIRDKPVFLRLSFSYNLSIFAPVFFPIFMQAFRIMN